MKYVVNFLILVIGLSLGAVLTVFHKDIKLLKDSDVSIIERIKELTKTKPDENLALIKKLHEEIQNSLNKDKETLGTAISTLTKLQSQVNELKESLKEKTYKENEVCQACELQKCMNKPEEKPIVKKVKPVKPKKLCDERKVNFCWNEKLSQKRNSCKEVKTKEKVQTKFKSTEKDVNLHVKQEVDTVIITVEPSRIIHPSHPICSRSSGDLRLECRRAICNK